MVINGNLPVSVSISASANPVCSGIAVTYTAVPNNGGGSPIYQWKVNGNNVGTNSTTYTYNPASDDQILCILTSNISCPIGNPATSNIFTMAVIPVVMTQSPPLMHNLLNSKEEYRWAEHIPARESIQLRVSLIRQQLVLVQRPSHTPILTHLFAPH
jgi:hypothetical protein